MKNITSLIIITLSLSCVNYSNTGFNQEINSNESNIELSNPANISNTYRFLTILYKLDEKKKLKQSRARLRKSQGIKDADLERLKPQSNRKPNLNKMIKDNNKTLIKKIERSKEVFDVLSDIDIYGPRLAENILSRLIKQGICINKKRKHDGHSALTMAAIKGHIDIVKLFIDAGADLNIQNKDGHTPLMLAAFQNHISTVKLLIDAGADLNIQNKNKETALMPSLYRNNIDIVKLLIDAGADLNIQNKDGHTPLMLALSNTHMDIAKLLVAAGSNPNIQNEHGDSEYKNNKNKQDIVDPAIDMDDTKIIENLTEHETDVKDQSKQTMQPNNQEKIELLIDANTNVDIEEENRDEGAHSEYTKCIIS